MAGEWMGVADRPVAAHARIGGIMHDIIRADIRAHATGFWDAVKCLIVLKLFI